MTITYFSLYPWFLVCYSYLVDNYLVNEWINEQVTKCHPQIEKQTWSVVIYVEKYQPRPLYLIRTPSHARTPQQCLDANVLSNSVSMMGLTQTPLYQLPAATRMLCSKPQTFSGTKPEAVLLIRLGWVGGWQSGSTDFGGTWPRVWELAIAWPRIASTWTGRAAWLRSMPLTL